MRRATHVIGSATKDACEQKIRDPAPFTFVESWPVAASSVKQFFVALNRLIDRHPFQSVSRPESPNALAFPFVESRRRSLARFLELIAPH
jgi:hypothetical protein